VRNTQQGTKNPKDKVEAQRSENFDKIVHISNANKRKPNKLVKTVVHTKPNTRKNGNKVKRYEFPRWMAAVYKTGI